ncbi:MAG: hypothetical protein HY914_21155 [Desulfomonile tiedjei]|nr:hypothetical protein [Desulfomonile tiedjei]
MAFRLIITALLWTLWCLVHSLLASEPIVRKTGLLRTRFKPYYRLAYSVFAAASLSLVWWLTPNEASIPLWSWSGELAAIRLTVVVVALAAAYLSFSSIGILDFLGLTALGIGRKGAVTSRKLITRGIYGRIRHPQFLAGLLLLWSRDLTDTGLVINVVLSLYLFVGARIEEQKLLAQFGPEYAHYKEQVPAFVPKRIV